MKPFVGCVCQNHCMDSWHVILLTMIRIAGPPKSRRGSETKTGTLSLFVLPHGLQVCHCPCLSHVYLVLFCEGSFSVWFKVPYFNKSPVVLLGVRRPWAKLSRLPRCIVITKKRSLCKEILEQSCSPLNEKDGDLVWFAFPNSKGQSHL